MGPGQHYNSGELIESEWGQGSITTVGSSLSQNGAMQGSITTVGSSLSQNGARVAIQQWGAH